MNIFELLKMMNTFQNPSQQHTENPSINNYPHDAYNKSQNTNNSNNMENMLPILMSLIGKNNDLSKVFSQTTKTENKKETPAPKDEILL